ncbi:unnamed protein product [Pleuronectes platessa]|uniref:Uncharacterized protein n=1 Tax=Pleuronectes platessa TaxID=8262 RepID=A0A9N7UVL6_PLEPL|nr:unnamed protein product [Pleuronectes platessa]
MVGGGVVRRVCVPFGRWFFSPLSLSCGNEVACLPSSLACHPDAPPSPAHAQAPHQLVSQWTASASVDGTTGTPLVPGLVPVFSSHRQQMSWFLREHSATPRRPVAAYLQTCHVTQLLALEQDYLLRKFNDQLHLASGDSNDSIDSRYISQEHQRTEKHQGP